MIVKGKIAIVYDIEVFPNLFTCTLKDTETKQLYVVELSERSNNIETLYKLFEDKQYMFVGYNNIHYDNVLINFLLQHKKAVLIASTQRVVSGLYKLSDIIVNGDDIQSWKEYKYFGRYATLDLLTMLFSSKLRVSLKELQVTMKYPNVEEYQGDFNCPVMFNEIDEVLKYNLNDVESTEELLNKCEKDIRLREGIEEEFNVNVLSKDGMTIGTEILKQKYLEKSGKRWDDIKNLRSPCDKIALKDVIFDNVSFKTKQLQDLLNEMKQLTVSPDRKGFEKVIRIQKMKVTVSVGGIHGDTGSEAILLKNDTLCLDSDVNSLYPSLIIKYNLIPKHLGNEFLDIYSKIREDRLYAKKNHQDVKNQTYKLALNGCTGNYQNEYSWLYDPVAVLRIRINGQLFLLMLTEMLIEAGAIVKQINTKKPLVL